MKAQKEKIVLIGAGSAMFTRGLLADVIRYGWEVELALVDINSQALEVAEKLSRKMIQVKKAPIQLSASTDRRNVLPGATVVICTIGVGGRRAWEQDVFIPRQFGIYQPVGDSVMPGGTSRALRMIPAMVGIAKDVLDLAPTALFFNYGNPMAPVCRAVRKATGANMIGLCHGVNHVATYLADQLGVARKEFAYSASGMNHLTWFTEFRIRGTDATTQMRKAARKILEGGPAAGNLGARFLEMGDADGAKDGKKDLNPFSWRLFELFGAFPAVLDRHVTEFFPHYFSAKNSYFGKTLGVEAYSFEDTIALGDKIFEEMQAEAFSQKPLSKDYFNQLGGEHEQVMEIIESIRHDRGRIFSANLPNQGQIPNLPTDAVVESPAVADGSGLHPLLQKPLPTAAAGILATRLMWVETIVEAALEDSYKKFIQALILDGAVNSLETAEKLARELLKAHAAYLPPCYKENL